MANNFPWQTAEYFDDGGTSAKANFTETLDSGKGDFPYFFDLISDQLSPMPFRGAGCFRVDLSASTNDVRLVEETADLTTGTDDQTSRFYFFVTTDLVMADTNVFEIFNYFSASGTATEECAVGIKYTDAAGFQVGIGAAAPTTFIELELGKWHCVEVHIDPAGSSGGEIQWRYDGAAQTTVGSLTQATTTACSWGVRNQDAGTTTGRVYFDQIVLGTEGTGGEPTWIGPLPERYAETIEVFDECSIFVGPGCIESVTLYDGGSGDCTAAVYDTDIGTLESPAKILLSSTANTETVDTSGPRNFVRGAYIVLGGTNPRAIIHIGPGAPYSEGSLRSYAKNRLPNGSGV